MSPGQNDPFELVQREVERLWRDLVYHRHPGAHFAQQPWAPPADVVVSENTARVILELAGIPRDAVRVRLEGRTLIVSGRRIPPKELHGAHYHRAEIYFGGFERALELPWEADPNGIEAKYSDGMLEICIHSATGGRVKDVRIHEGADPATPR